MKRYDVRQYSGLSDKTTGSIPEIFYYDGNYPTATIFLYPVPSSVNTITLYSKKALTQFASLDSTLILPPEYETALVYNLAVWVAPEYEREPSRQVQKIAAKSLMAVERQNLRNTSVNISTITVPRPENQDGDYNVLRGY